MKRLIILIIFFILLFSVNSYAACGGVPTEDPAGTWTTYDASYDCVNDCITNYADNDETVIIKDGNATWESTLVIPKYITLQGGSGTLTRSAGYLLQFTPSSVSGSYTFRVTNITCSAAGFIKLQTSSRSFTQQYVRIDHNTIDTTGVWFYVYNGLFTGCVDNNTVTGYGHMDLYGPDCNSGGDDATWRANTYTFGSNKLLYFEDNSITLTYDLLSSGGHGGQYAFRYNDITFLDTGGYVWVWDSHGNQACDHSCGHRIIEAYGNDISREGGNVVHGESRGGKHIFAFNKGISSCKMYDDECDLLNPCNSGDCGVDEYCVQTDDGQPLHISDTYFWNNRPTTDGTDACINSIYPLTSDCDAGDCTNCNLYLFTPTENTDFWLYDSTFDGSTGIGCGSDRTAINLSGDPDGVGFWESTISCTSLSDNNVGINPTTPISGTLYISSSEAWVAHWTPYTYPHPLRQENSAALTDALADGATEAQVVTGGANVKLIITLTGATFIATFGDDVQATTDFIALVDSGGTETYGWDAVVKANLVYTDIVRDSDTQATINFGAEATYAITTNETVTVTIPASCTSSDTAIVATPTFEITASNPACTMAGTLSDNATEAEVKTGGETLIGTVSDTELVATFGDDNAITTAFIALIDSAQAEAGGWDAQVKANLDHTMISRDSATQWTLTTPAAAGYDISANESITVKLPTTATDSGVEITCTPTVGIIFFDVSTEKCTGMTLQ